MTLKIIVKLNTIRMHFDENIIPFENITAANTLYWLSEKGIMLAMKCMECLGPTTELALKALDLV